jgi:hypothetical protein
MCNEHKGRSVKEWACSHRWSAARDDFGVQSGRLDPLVKNAPMCGRSVIQHHFECKKEYIIQKKEIKFSENSIRQSIPVLYVPRLNRKPVILPTRSCIAYAHHITSPVGRGWSTPGHDVYIFLLSRPTDHIKVLDLAGFLFCFSFQIL